MSTIDAFVMMSTKCALQTLLILIPGHFDELSHCVDIPTCEDVSWPATLSNDNILCLLICVHYCVDVVAVVVVDINSIQFDSNSETDGISLQISGKTLAFEIPHGFIRLRDGSTKIRASIMQISV